jgi:hypothetical protein
VANDVGYGLHCVWKEEKGTPFTLIQRLKRNACRAASQCNRHCLLLCPSVDSVPNLALSTSLFLLTIEFCNFFGWQCQIFPFQTLVFAVQHTIVNSCLVFSDDASQKGVTFLMAAIQKALADGCVCALL